ncbi:hypothetical protein C8Q73DRAFT_789475 [Cubamyces lactineus]|nr:hypothetical protein C8Q73DRAFT_789475 [Cubamyces lactineus]
MPALEYLMVSAQLRVPLALRKQWDLSVSRFPALKVLHLACASVRWCPTVISSLTCLDIRGCAYVGPALSSDEFLGVLQCCYSLRELRLLDEFVSSALAHHSQSVPTDNFARAQKMPQLRTLVIEDRPKIIAWLLSCIRVASDGYISIVGSIPGSELLSNAFRSLLPPEGRNAYVIPTFSLTHGSINMWGSDAGISVSSSNGFKMCLQLHWGGAGELDFYMTHTMWQFPALFPCASIETMNIGADYDHVRGKTSWYTLLSNFHCLKKLRLVGPGNITPFFAALKHVFPSE